MRAVFAPIRAEALAASQPAWPPPITTTSNDSSRVVIGRLLYPVRRSGKQQIRWIVSRETSADAGEQEVEMNQKLLLADTKLPKDDIQDVVDIDPPQQPPER